MLLAQFLDGVIRQGDLRLVDAAGQSHRFGDGSTPHVTIRIHDRATQRHMLLNPRLAVGEAYTDGRLTIEDGTLYDFLDLGAVTHAIGRANVRTPITNAHNV